MAKNWTESEVDLTIADYMSMLLTERAGGDYSKAEHSTFARAPLGPRLNLQAALASG